MDMYRMNVTRVIDGDTVEADVTALLFNVDITIHRLRIRLADIDAPEIRGAERSKGLRSKRFLELWLAMQHHQVYADITHKDSFGRWIATLYTMTDGCNINKTMVHRGYAKWFN